MEGSELFRNAEQWLTDNPGKNLADYRKETNYSGPALKTRHRKGEPVRVSYKGKSSESQTRRVAAEKPKTSEEAAAVRRVRRQARQQTASTLHQHASGGRPSIAEHDVRLASGGTNEFMSISDPDFKSFKDTLEQKTERMFGKEYVVDIDEVSGYPRVVESKYHNKFQPVSRQPGITIEPGMNIDNSLMGLQRRIGMRAAVSGNASQILRSGMGYRAVLPGPAGLMEFVPMIDEITGGHLENALGKGVSAMQNMVRSVADAATDAYASSKPLGYNLNLQ